MLSVDNNEKSFAFWKHNHDQYNRKKESTMIYNVYCHNVWYVRLTLNMPSESGENNEKNWKVKTCRLKGKTNLMNLIHIVEINSQKVFFIMEIPSFYLNTSLWQHS